MAKPLIRLSPTSGLNLFKECPKCFYLHHKHNVKRPSGPFPSLPGGMDNVIKKYFDKFRGTKKGLPPELVGKVEGKLVPDLKLMEQWRDWRSGMRYVDKKLGAELSGALDDCLIDGDLYIPLDYKTRGYPPGPLEDSQRYYGTQLDTYSLLLWASGYKIAPFAYLAYFFPKEVRENGIVEFNIELKKLEVSPKRAKEVFESAVKCLKGPEPKQHQGCAFCNWQKIISEFD